MTADAIREALTELLASHFDLNDVDRLSRLTATGLDSMDLLELLVMLEERFPFRLDEVRLNDALSLDALVFEIIQAAE